MTAAAKHHEPCRECPADELSSELREVVSGLALVAQDRQHLAESMSRFDSTLSRVAEQVNEIALVVAYMQGRMERTTPPPGRRLSKQIVIFGSGAGAVVAALVAAARALAG